MNEIHSLTDSLHCCVNSSILHIEYFLRRLEKQHPTGFDPGTTPAIQLKSDYNNLLNLARRIDALRLRMTDKRVA